MSSGGRRVYDDLHLEAYERQGDRLSYPVGPSQVSALSSCAAAVEDDGRYDSS